MLHRAYILSVMLKICELEDLAYCIIALYSIYLMLASVLLSQKQSCVELKSEDRVEQTAFLSLEDAASPALGKMSITKR